MQGVLATTLKTAAGRDLEPFSILLLLSSHDPQYQATSRQQEKPGSQQNTVFGSKLISELNP